MKDEEISQTEYRRRIEQMKKEMMEVIAFEKSSMEQKAEMIEYLMQLEGGRALAFEDFSELKTKENLKRLEERLLLMQKFVEQKNNQEELKSQMKLYKEELMELGKLKKEMEEDSIDQVKQILHKIKPSIVYLGNQKLMEIRTDLHDAALKGSLVKEQLFSFVNGTEAGLTKFLELYRQ